MRCAQREHCEQCVQVVNSGVTMVLRDSLVYGMMVVLVVFGGN